jgi:hypothetical protein
MVMAVTVTMLLVVSMGLFVTMSRIGSLVFERRMLVVVVLVPSVNIKLWNFGLGNLKYL